MAYPRPRLRFAGTARQTDGVGQRIAADRRSPKRSRSGNAEQFAAGSGEGGVLRSKLCSSASLTTPGVRWCSHRKRREVSTTTTSAQSTYVGLLREGDGVAARALGMLGLERARRDDRPRNSIGRGAEHRPRKSPSRREPRRHLNCRCERRSNSNTTTSVPSTSCSAWSGRDRESR